VQKREDGSVIVTNGTLHYDDRGDRVIVQGAHPQYPNPLAMQELYSRASATHAPKEFDGQPDGPGLRIVWTEAIELSCGGCGYSFGRYVAYNAAGSEYGIVEDVQTIRQRNSGVATPNTAERNLSPGSRYLLAGTQADTARTTFAFFRCRKCGLHYHRSLFTFGMQLFIHRPKSYALDHGVRTAESNRIQRDKNYWPDNRAG
jgi:hypothetical protein